MRIFGQQTCYNVPSHYFLLFIPRITNLLLNPARKPSIILVISRRAPYSCPVTQPARKIIITLLVLSRCLLLLVAVIISIFIIHSRSTTLCGSNSLWGGVPGAKIDVMLPDFKPTAESQTNRRIVFSPLPFHTSNFLCKTIFRATCSRDDTGVI